MAIYKNVAGQKVAVYAFDGTTAAGSDPAKTGDAANITAQISLDGGVAASTNDVNPTELEATDHPGIYVFDLTQAETNADMIVLSAVSATGNILIDPVVIYTLPEPVAITDVISDGTALNCTSGTLDAVTTAGSVTGAVGSVTGNVGGNVTGSVGSLGTTAKSDVNAEVADVIRTDAVAELGAVPAANASLEAKVNWLFLLARNKVTQSATTQTVFADDTTTAVATAATSTAAGTTTRAEFS